MKVLVCGSRDWTNTLAIFNRIALLPNNTTIIHGNCRGADKIAAQEARRRSFQVEAFLADWVERGSRAGPERNRRMLDTKPDLVIAFCSDLSKSRGTKDCVSEAQRRGIPVEVIEGP